MEIQEFWGTRMDHTAKGRRETQTIYTLKEAR